MEQVLNDTLVLLKQDKMVETFLVLLSDCDVPNLNLMYNLLTRYNKRSEGSNQVVAGRPDCSALRAIVETFERYLVDYALDNMKSQAITIVNDCEKFVEMLQSMFNMATNLVVKAFNSDPHFFTSRDKAFDFIVNDKTVFEKSSALKNNRFVLSVLPK